MHACKFLERKILFSLSFSLSLSSSMSATELLAARKEQLVNDLSKLERQARAEVAMAGRESGVLGCVSGGRRRAARLPPNTKKSSLHAAWMRTVGLEPSAPGRAAGVARHPWREVACAWRHTGARDAKCFFTHFLPPACLCLPLTPPPFTPHAPPPAPRHPAHTRRSTTWRRPT